MTNETVARSIPLCKITDALNIKREYIPPDFETRMVVNTTINRPGLQLVGFFSHFDKSRIQVMGIVECMYLKTLPGEERAKIFAELFKRDIPALIVSNNMEIYPECRELAAKYATPVFSTPRDTSEFCAELISRLTNELAPRITRHGVLVEVYGEGILLLGESGVGKSETAIELVKRGHCLVADDAVEIKKVSYNRLLGTAPELIRHYMELRGIGIIDVRRLFGLGAVREESEIGLIIKLEIWQDDTQYERIADAEIRTELLDVAVPTLTIPVKPGRNLAAIIEVAAMNNKQRKMGYNAAKELMNSIDK
ncbi:MAG: HPr(Ser) kinase/phosphatase [Oscillospiraceae bacterium]|jgi:HPr kinase/phosphorylase|nr:HPr(Ser) kinase/phosphatase [Oscillospiraceae bacterium]